jgi:hypothetical protein
MPNKRLKRTNIRCHLLCKETHKSRHQTFARLAGRYVCEILSKIKRLA